MVSSDNGNVLLGKKNLRASCIQNLIVSGYEIGTISSFLKKMPQQNGTGLMLADPVQKQRKKSMSVFGGLVSPKLQTAQLSFETAPETLVEMANLRATMVSTCAQVRKELEGTKGG